MPKSAQRTCHASRLGDPVVLSCDEAEESLRPIVNADIAVASPAPLKQISGMAVFGQSFARPRGLKAA